VSAGEPSGDAHAAQVIHNLLQQRPDLTVEGIGGPHLVQAGASLLGDIRNLSVVGLAEGLDSLPAHVRLFRKIDHRLATADYDLALLVDYPGFNLRLAARAARHGVPVLYYIAPQVWAWGQWRVSTLRQHVTQLAVVLPFEELYFRDRGVAATFVGHPLLDHAVGDRASSRRALGLPSGAPTLAVFPGSRSSERQRLWPAFRKTAELLRGTIPDLEIVVGTAHPTADPPPGFRFCPDQSLTILAAADVALCKSGTTTLEAAISGVPMAVAYRVHPLTYAVARRLVRVPHVSLVNLVAGRAVVPEFLQRRVVPRDMRRALEPLFNQDHRATLQQRADLVAVQHALGSPGVGRRVAELALEVAA